MTGIIWLSGTFLYDVGVKPSVPETGTVIRLEGNSALIMLKGGGSCKGCGAAKIGLCRAGKTSMFLTAGNNLGAGVGDTVRVDLDKRIKRKGYLLAYGVPLLSLIAGTLAGHVIGDYLSTPSLEAIGGFVSLIFASLLSFRRLRMLDKANRMVISKVMSGDTFSGEVMAEEEIGYMKYSGQY
jgi:positive regulator of sigma E activity